MFRWFIGFWALCLSASAAQAVQISLPNIEAAPGETVRVPVELSQFAAGDEILSSNMDIRFDDQIVLLDLVDVNRSGSLASSWIIAANARKVPDGGPNDGQVLIGAATASARITGEGVFFFLELQVAENATIGATSPLDIQTVLLNNGTPSATTVNGSLTVIDDRIKADFIGIPLSGIAPLEVKFEDQSSGEISTYAWNFGDGGTSSDQHPVYVYDEPGTYTVSLTVSNQSGSNTETKEDYIKVEADQRPPEIIEGPIAQGTTHNSTNIFWVTNEEGDSQVQYCRIRIRPILANERELVRWLKEELIERGNLTAVSGNNDDDDDGGDSNDEQIRRWMLRGGLPHFDNHGLFPLIFDCNSKVVEDLVIDHNVPLTGLTPFSFYIYRVRSADKEGNNSDWKGGFFITRGRPDGDPPVITRGPFAHPAVDKALIKWWTNEPSNSLVQYSVNPDYSDGVRVLQDDLVFRHNVWLEGLEPNTTYYYRVRSSDASGNASQLRTGRFRTLGSDDRPPVIISGPKVTMRTPFKARIEWKTNKPSTSRVNFGESEDYGRFAASDDLVQRHKILLTHLEERTLYHYQVVSTDASGNTVESGDRTFVTRGDHDNRWPGIVVRPWVVFRGTDRCTIGWKMDKPSNGWLEYGLTTDYGHRVEISEFDRDFRIVATGLAPGKTYHGRFHMVDLEGNGPTRSEDFTFFTSARRDRSAPVIEGGPTVVKRTDTSVTIGWRTNEAGDSRVEFGLGGDLDRAAGDVELVREHFVTLTDLEPGTTYQGQVFSTDAFGNGPVESEVFNFSTRPAPDADPPVIYAGPAVVAYSHDSAVIALSTDELAEITVEYGPDTNYGLEVISDRLGTAHRIALPNLTPGTVYHFQVSAVDASGNGPTRSRDLSFRTKGSAGGTRPQIRRVSVRKVTDSSALIKWHTSKPATSIVDYGTTDAYGDRVEDPDFEREHRMRLSGLEPNTLYHFRVVSQSLDGGESASADFTFRTDAESDRRPPVIVRRPELIVSHSTATIRWRTNEPCFPRVRVGTLNAFGTAAERIFESTRAREEQNITITGLQRGTRYFFSLISRDLNGNQIVIGNNGGAGKVVAPVAQGGEISFTTDSESDFTAPAIVDGPRLVSQSDTEALIAWTTDEIGDSQLFLERDGQLELVESIPEHDFDHQALLTDLEPGTTYRIQVASTDPVGNGPGLSELFSFTTSASADIAAPQIVVDPEVIAVSDRIATITWATDEASTSEVLFGPDGLDLATTDPELATAHRIELADLEPNTTYRFRVRSFDALDNGPAQSAELSFRTAAAPDVQAPALVGAPQVVALGDRSAVVAWTTDEAADAFVQYGAGESLDQAVGRIELGTAHQVTLTNLEPNTTYRFVAASVDAAGNGPSESAELTLTTLAAPDQVAPAAPDGLAGQNAGAGQVDLSWEAVADADVGGYNIYRALGAEPWALIAGPIADASYRDQGLASADQYHWRVTAVDRAGNESAASTHISLTVELRGPGDFQGDGQVGLDDFFMLAERFGSESGEDRYGMEFDFNGDGRIDFGDFFVFVDLFGTQYGSARPVATADEAPFAAELSLQPSAAGQYAVDIRGLGLDGLRGYGLRLRYGEQGARFLGAEGTDGELFSVLGDESGALTLGGYRTDGSTYGGDQVLARLFFEALPGAAPTTLRLEEVAAPRGGEYARGRLQAVQVRLAPTDYALLPNFPNPFNPETEIRYQLPVAGPVSLRLYDVLGQEIAVLSEGYKTAGYHRLRWDGRDAQGRPAASGPYFYVLEAAHFRQVRKLMLLR